MKFSIKNFLDKQEKTKELEKKVEDRKLKAENYELLKKDKIYKKLKKDLDFHKEQLRIIGKRVGKEKIGEYMAKKTLKSVPWFKPYRKNRQI